MKVKTHSLLEIVVSLHYIKLREKKIEKKEKKKNGKILLHENLYNSCNIMRKLTSGINAFLRKACDKQKICLL